MKKSHKYIFTFISFFLITLLTSCVPDVSEYDYIFDHWKGEWEGWYEITNAKGEYADYNGLRQQCSASISMDPKTWLWIGLFDADGEKLWDFTGAYKHNDNYKYGQAWFFEVKDSNKNSIPAEIPLDGESQEDDNLGIFQGTIGEGDDSMDILLHLRRKIDEDNVYDTSKCMMTIQAVNSGVDEFGQEVGYGEAEPKTYEVYEDDCFYEGFDELIQNSNKDSDGITYDEYMTIKKIGDDEIVLEIRGDEMSVEYNKIFELSSLIMVMDGASTYYRIQFTK